VAPRSVRSIGRHRRYTPRLPSCPAGSSSSSRASCSPRPCFEAPTWSASCWSELCRSCSALPPSGFSTRRCPPIVQTLWWSPRATRRPRARLGTCQDRRDIRRPGRAGHLLRSQHPSPGH
jgi:hypothetical protein